MVLFAAAVLSGTAACNDNLKPGTVDLDPVDNPTEIPDVNVMFNHPCAYVNASDIARVKQYVAAADANDPVYASWLQFCGSGWAQESVKPDALETVVRGDATGTGTTENYIL